MVSARILIVEDESILAVHLSQMISEMGYQVSGIAASGEEAVQQALANKPEAILMDIHLRGAMTGIQAAAEIHRTTTIPIIYLTAYTDEELFQQAKITDAYAYLAKPIRERELRASLEMALYKHGIEKHIKHLNQVLRAIRNVNQLITRERDPQHLLEQACEILLQTRGYSFIWISQLEDDLPRLAASAGEGRSLIERLESTAHANELPWTAAMRQKQPVICRDLLQDECTESLNQAARQADFHSAAFIPILRGDIVGCLCAFSEYIDVLNEDELELLQEMADDLAYGLYTIKEEAARLRAEEALRESEKHYRLISENSGDVIWTIDLARNCFSYISPSVYQLRGLTPAEVLAQPIEQAITPASNRLIVENLPRRIAALQAGDESARTATHEIEQCHKDGSIIPTEAVTTIITDAQQNAVEIVGVTHNITERKRAEAEMQRYIAELEVLYETSRTTSNLLDPHEIAQKLVDTLSKKLNWHHAAVRLYDAQKDKAELAAFNHPGLTDAQIEAQILRINQIIPGTESGLSGWVIRTGQSIRCQRVRENPHYIETYPEIRSGLYIPIQAGDRTIGSIAVESEQEDAFSEDDERMLTTMASQAGMSIENAKLFITTQQEIAERKRAEAQLYEAERFAEATLNALSTQVCVLDQNGVILSTNRTWREFGIQNGLPPDYQHIGVNYLTVCENASGRDAEYGILAANGIRAVLNQEIEHFSVEYPCHKPDEERWFLARVSRFPGSGPLQLVISHENITEIRRINQLMNVRLRLSTYASSHNLVELLQKTLDEAAAVTYSQVCLAWLVREDQTGPSLKVGSSSVLPQSNGSAQPDPMLLDQTELWAECIRERKAIIRNQYTPIQTDPALAPIEQRIQRILLVPVLRSDRVVAILAMANKPSDYSQKDRAALEQLASAAWDITARKQAETELQSSEEKYRVLVESLDSIVALFDPTGRLTFINEIAARQLGGSQENLIGKTVSELFPEPYAGLHLYNIQETFRQNKGRTIESPTVINGQTRWYRNSLQPLRDENGQAVLVLLNATDITELKAIQTELRELTVTLEDRIKERSAEVEDLYNNAPCGYHSLDANGKYVHINNTELNWLGYDQAEMIGQPIINFFTPASQVQFEKIFPSFKQTGEMFNLELECVRKDGSSFPVSINATAVFDSTGSFLMSRTTVFDITEQHKADLALRESEARLRLNRDELSAANAALEKAARLKDEFLASMSHELRTPLTGILGLSEVLQMPTYGEMNDKQLRAVKNINSSGQHLLELINDILDLSKIEANKLDMQFQPCAVEDICHGCLQLIKGLANQKNQTVRFTIQPTSMMVMAESRRLKQILVNLLSNAVKFTPENGELGLEVNGDPIQRVIRFTIWDKGIGIKHEDLDKLFHAFVQIDSSLSRAYTGTGLGLALVRRMVEMHGGSVEVESEWGAGSRFSVLLPWVIPNLARPMIENSQRGMHQTIPISEQTDTQRALTYLRSLGVTRIIRANTLNAVEAAARINPAAIFLDLDLPSAAENHLLEAFQANPLTTAIPLILCANTLTPATPAACLTRPLQEADLTAELTRLFGEAPYPEPLLVVMPETSEAHVLLTDDNNVILETLGDFLESNRFQVSLAHNGSELLERVAELHPDIILLDIQMPGLDGLETARRIRAHPDPIVAATPIAAVTALVMPNDRERCLEAGINEYLSKPVHLPKLVSLIQHMTGKNTRTSASETEFPTR